MNKEFFLRRIHSLAGLGLVFFIVEHLLTNSRAALWIGDDGKGFISAVNWIHGLPYLELIEIFILALPILVHGAFGIKYLWEGKFNSWGGGGKEPRLNYGRNVAFTWQRMTSWLLLIGVVAHVMHMRFIEYPDHIKLGSENLYIVRVNEDIGLATVAKRLGVELFSAETVANMDFQEVKGSLLEKQNLEQRNNWIEILRENPLTDTQYAAVAPDFGTAELLIVRETFKMPIMLILYSIFVVVACFHAFNGLWTGFITWGFAVTEKAQKKFLKVSQGLMIIFIGLGLSAVWLTYWVNLYT